MTQTDRVLAALSRAGARGITAVDFAAPNVCDGGKPIMRVAARVKDLRDAGIEIETDGERDSCAVYRLAVRAALNPVPGRERVVEPVSPAAPTGTLFDAPAAPAPKFWEAA